MSDPETAALYRNDLYQYYGMKVPTNTLPPPRVLFWLRPSSVGRAFDNLDDMLAIPKAYGINYT